MSTRRWHAATLLTQAVWPWLATFIVCTALTHRALQSVQQALQDDEDVEQLGATAWELRDRIGALPSASTGDDASRIGHLLQATWADHPELVSIDVFALNGRTLYSTDGSAVGTPVAAGWLAAPRHWQPSAAAHWSTGADGLSTYVVALDPPLRDHAAYVGVTFSLPPTATPAVLSAGMLDVAATALVLGMACAAFCLIYRPLTGFVRRQLERISGATAADFPHEDTLTAALARVQEAEARLAFAERQLSKEGSRDE
ncbi:hypothetical protein PQQ99_36220 [Paraburkholderia sediminicola]|uniref:hypothetical protein n=1 Tax=Paraburkholderia sediminicola TaxID=458836 RepID=UPI0038B7BB7C